MAVAMSFEDFFVETCARVVGLIALVTRDAGAAEDAAQVAFERAHHNWEKVSRLDRPDLWVVKVGTRIAIDGWRRRKHEVPLVGRDRSVVDQEIEGISMRWGLTRLSAKERRVVVLHYAEGRPITEVAKQVGESPTTVRVRLQRARSRLRAIFSEELGR
jgi:RNA polymerase sigma-70 factor (ECF subfamily)